MHPDFGAGPAIASRGLFGVSLGIPMLEIRGSSLFASIGGFIIAALWIFLWFAQLQILFDDSRQELVVRTRGYFRSHDRRISVRGGRAVQIRRVSTGLAGRTWRVTVDFADGRSEHVTDLSSGLDTRRALDSTVWFDFRHFVSSQPCFLLAVQQVA